MQVYQRSFAMQLMAVMMAGSFLLTAQVTLTTPQQTTIVRTMSSYYNKAATAVQNSASTGLTVKHPIPDAVVESFVQNHEHLKDGNLPLINSWVAQHKAEIKRRAASLTDNDMEALAQKLRTKYGFSNTGDYIRAVIHNSKPGSDIDLLASLGTKAAIDEGASKMRQYEGIAQKIRERYWYLAVVPVSQNPFAMVEPLPAAFFGAFGIDCARWNAIAGVYVFAGTVIGIAGGEVSPVAWLGDGLVVSGVFMQMMVPFMGC